MASVPINLTFSSCSTRLTSTPYRNTTHFFKSSSLNFKLRKLGHKLQVTCRSSSPLSEMVTESIKNAEQICAEDPISGECAAAWDEVEEVSAAASDARLKRDTTETDPLESYCKDNPGTEECRIYDD